MTDTQKLNARRSALLLATVALGFFLLVIFKYLLIR